MESRTNRSLSYGSNHILYNSYIFHTRVQYPEESFTDYVNNVIELAGYCDFEAKNRMIRDQIIVGMRNLNLRYELFKLSNPTLDNLLDYLKTIDEPANREQVNLTRDNNRDNANLTQQIRLNREAGNSGSNSRSLESNGGNKT